MKGKYATKDISLIPHAAKVRETGRQMPRLWSATETSTPKQVEYAVLDRMNLDGCYGTHDVLRVFELIARAQLIAVSENPRSAYKQTEGVLSNSDCFADEIPCRLRTHTKNGRTKEIGERRGTKTVTFVGPQISAEIQEKFPELSHDFSIRDLYLFIDEKAASLSNGNIETVTDITVHLPEVKETINLLKIDYSSKFDALKEIFPGLLILGPIRKLLNDGKLSYIEEKQIRWAIFLYKSGLDFPIRDFLLDSMKFHTKKQKRKAKSGIPEKTSYVSSLAEVDLFDLHKKAPFASTSKVSDALLLVIKNGYTPWNDSMARQAKSPPFGKKGSNLKLSELRKLEEFSEENYFMTLVHQAENISDVHNALNLLYRVAPPQIWLDFLKKKATRETPIGYSGCPDLLIWGADTFELIEVKTKSDTLRESQISFIDEIIHPLRAPFSIGNIQELDT